MERIGHLLERLEATDPSATPRTVLDTIRDTLELTNVAYLALHVPPLTRRKPYIEVTYPDDWVAHYEAQGYVRDDPVLRAPLRSILPTDWQTLARTTPRVQQMFAEARAHGIGHQGLTVPIRGPNGELALFSVTCDADDREWAEFKRRTMGTLQVIAHHFHDRVLTRHQVTFPKVRLAPRETEVLKWAANGKSVQDTAVILGLSPHTVQTYLEMARYRLQALNTTHAVARALQLQLIFPPD
jgi:DNA-binding CsgD family transcriptional regulator